MFEGSKKIDEKAKKRFFFSFGASTLLIGSTILALIFFTPELKEVIKEHAPIEVNFIEVAPPPPPPPPPPPGGNKTKKKKVEKKKKKKKKKKRLVQPQQVVEPKEKIEEPPEEEPEEAVDGGVAGGVAGGIAGGVIGGTIGGQIGGVLGGQLGGQLGGKLGGYMAPSRSQISPKKGNPRPKWPQKAKSLNIKQTSCSVLFYVDEKGKTEKVEISGCPSVFHKNVEKATLRWRFHPVKDESGKAFKAKFKLKVTFRLR